MICLIDNYDSFTYNLYQYLGEIEPDILVLRNDKVNSAKLRELAPDHIVISPGPGRPEDAGNSIEIIKNLSGVIPILGICLGHQAIAKAMGADIIYADSLFHGKTSEIRHYGSPIFDGLDDIFTAGRYHSLIVDRETLPETLSITAVLDDGTIMGIKHTKHQTYGLQFHPESILTSGGKQVLANFLRSTLKYKGE